MFRPTVAVLEFAGHGGRPCIDQRSGTLEEKYVHDVEVATALLRERGATVLWAGIPSGVGQLWARWWTSEIFATTAARWGEPAYYSDLSAQSVFDTATGTFTTHLPCLANETAFHGCVGGQIQVRSLQQHFCPDDGFPCQLYASAPSGSARRPGRSSSRCSNPLFGHEYRVSPVLSTKRVSASPTLPPMRRLVVLAIVAAGLAVGACAPTKGVPRPDVVLWGDSFGEQVAPYLPYDERVFGGLNPCLVVENVTTRPAPPVAVLLFVGSNLPPHEPEPHCDYQWAVDTITSSLQSRGSRVLWIAALCNPHRPESAGILNAIYPNPVYGPTYSIGGCDPAFREPDGHLNEVGKQRVANEIMQAVG